MKISSKWWHFNFQCSLCREISPWLMLCHLFLAWNITHILHSHFTGIETIHHSDVTMGAIASQINSLTSVYSTVYSDADQREHQSSASLAFVHGIHRWLVNSLQKWPVLRIMFPFDDVIMQMMLVTQPWIIWLNKFIWRWWNHWTNIIKQNRLHMYCRCTALDTYLFISVRFGLTCQFHPKFMERLHRKSTIKKMGKFIHNGWLKCNKTKHNKSLCIVYGMHCGWLSFNTDVTYIGRDL